MGLSAATKASVREQVTHFAVPGWDLPFHQSHRSERPHLRAMSARPFLPQYFSGYDCYLWLDADTWVQKKFAIEGLFAAAQGGAMGIVPQIHPSYVHHSAAANWRRRILKNYFGDEGLALMEANTYYNSGAFSLLANAPHWAAWTDHFRAALRFNPEARSDQNVLNFALWKEQLPTHPLPALCNWCCHLALPSISLEAGELCEPHGSNQPLGIVHLTANTKDWHCMLEGNGKKFQVNLRFKGMPPQGDAFAKRYIHL